VKTEDVDNYYLVIGVENKGSIQMSDIAIEGVR